MRNVLFSFSSLSPTNQHPRPASLFAILLLPSFSHPSVPPSSSSSHLLLSLLPFVPLKPHCPSSLLPLSSSSFSSTSLSFLRRPLILTLTPPRPPRGGVRPWFFRRAEGSRLVLLGSVPPAVVRQLAEETSQPRTQPELLPEPHHAPGY